MSERVEERARAWAAELAEMARAGAARDATPYDVARYARIAALAEEVGASGPPPPVAAPLSPGSWERAALAARTPIVAADAAVFDRQGRILLIQRADSRLWALPGGAADVGEPPAAVAEREAWEETGLRVRAERLIGLYARPRREAAGRLYVLVFLCRRVTGSPRVTHETLDAAYAAPDALPPLHPGHDRRIQDAFAARVADRAWMAVYR